MLPWQYRHQNVYRLCVRVVLEPMDRHPCTIYEYIIENESMLTVVCERTSYLDTIYYLVHYKIYKNSTSVMACLGDRLAMLLACLL